MFTVRLVHLASKGVDRGKAFGGKCNGKDVRKVMEQTEYVF